jgi:enduracididine biosynthesis enzyme MppR
MTGTRHHQAAAGSSTSGLLGYSLPMSPTGRSSLVSPPPWYFSGEVLFVDYIADPDAVRRFLPLPLREGEIDGRAAAIFGDWQSCSDGGTELLDPVRAQHREFCVVVACTWKGKPVARCPLCWVDTDFSLVRGLIQGYPKKLGSIVMTRSFGIGRAGAACEPGVAFAGTLAAGHQRLAEARVTLAKPDDPPALMLSPLIHTRYFPAWDPGSPAVEELVTGGSSDQSFANVWSGDAKLTLFESPSEDVALLAPVEILGGYRFSFAETLTGGRLLEP